MKSTLNITVLLLVLLSLFSCKREMDLVFDENASVRINKSVEEAYDVLQANKGGWLMKYFPSNTREFGGYTLFVRFDNNAQVTLVSDIDVTPTQSTYSIVPEAGAILSFNGFNKVIHRYSEPGIDSGDGAPDSGMKGDFEFLVLHASADSVVLKGKKSANTIRMYPLKGNEFSTLPPTYQEAGYKFHEFTTYKLERKDKTLTDLRTSYRTFTDTKVSNSPIISFRVIPGGLELYEEQELDGVKFDKMTFVGPSDAYPYGYYTEATKSIKIVPAATPLNRYFTENLWSVTFDGLGPVGKFYWTEGRNKLTTNNLVLNQFIIGTLESGGDKYEGVIYIMNGGADQGLIIHSFTLIEGTTDQVKMTFGGSLYTLQGDFGVPYWGNGLSSFSDILLERTFKITGDGSAKPEELLLTDVELEENTIRVYAEDKPAFP